MSDDYADFNLGYATTHVHGMLRKSCDSAAGKTPPNYIEACVDPLDRTEQKNRLVQYAEHAYHKVPA